MDSDLVGIEALEIPADSFVVVDLADPLELDRSFDIAISLEVGEHLPEPSAETLVESLAKLAPLVLFSAAIPYQGRDRTHERTVAGLLGDDVQTPRVRGGGCPRPLIWEHPDVKYWYAQNMLLYVRKETNSDYPALDARPGFPIRGVHPTLYLQTV